MLRPPHPRWVDGHIGLALWSCFLSCRKDVATRYVVAGAVGASTFAN